MSGPYRVFQPDETLDRFDAVQIEYVEENPDPRERLD